MYFILPAFSLACDLKALTEEFMASDPINIEYKELTIDQYVDIIQGIVDDHINSLTCWCSDSDSSLKLLGEIFDWFEPEAIKLQSEESEISPQRYKLMVVSNMYYIQVIDLIIVRFSEIVDEFIPSDNWNVWHMRRLGDDLLVEKGEDYRIIDWTRRMESGEWSHGD